MRVARSKITTLLPAGFPISVDVHLLETLEPQRNAHVPAASLLKYLHLAYLSRPREERPLYRAIRRLRPRSIVEIGIGNGLRATRLIDVAMRYNKLHTIRYTGIDLFEARPPEQSGLSLKRAYQLLNSRGAKVQLLPGDPFSVLSRRANALSGTDMLLISNDQDEDSLGQAWFYVPRMLHERSLIFVQRRSADHATNCFDSLTPADIAARARSDFPKRNRAA